MNRPGDAIVLIHAEIDGELSSAGRAELGRLLLADPALRVLREQLRRTCTALDGVPLEDAPPGLRSTVMESLPASPPGHIDRHVHLSRRLFRPTLRIAAAFAGGLLAAALAFQLALDNHVPDVRELAGTIADFAAGPSELEMQLDDVSGVVRFERRASGPVLVARIVARRPVQVIARLGDEERTLTFPAALQQDTRSLELAFAPAAGTDGGRIQVAVIDVATGDVLQRALLKPTVSN